MNKNKLVVQAVFAMLVMYCIVLTGCPKDTQIHKAARTSFELAGLTKDVIAGVDKAYADHAISTDLKNQMADRLSQIASGGSAFNVIVTQLSTNQTIPADKWILLQTILNDRIVTPFLGLLELLKAISPGTVTVLLTAVAALRTAILIISQTVSQDTFDRVKEASYV